MIRINDLNKYYFKGKASQIHVINNTSLSFDHTGLVCMLGPSGCGKTTLLNVIGGLDSYDSGTILYEGKKLSKKSLDTYRVCNIGFINQNYILFPEKTVKENLEIVLDMFSLTKEEKDERIIKALSAVHLEKYQKRQCKMLSGGQMQRVAIARALVKSPKVIIADEPTGNLDEKNTTEVMNIIKSLSDNCLVILVTHEERLANFYADRIIRLRDGKVIYDEINDNLNPLVSKDDVNIYLGEYQKEEFNYDNINIRYFYQHQKPKIKLDIVFHNNTYYIYPKESEVKVSFLDELSEQMFIEGKREEIKKENYHKMDINISELSHKEVHKSMISWIRAWKEAIKNFKNIRIKQKIMLIVFIISSVLICISLGVLQKSRYVDEIEFLTFSKNANIYYQKPDFDNVEILPNIPICSLSLSFHIYEQVNKSTYVNLINGTLSSSNKLDEQKMLCGTKPKNDNEIVLSKWIVDIACVNRSDYGHSLIEMGFIDYNQLIGKEVFYNYYGEKKVKTPYIISGISNDEDSIYYVTENALYLFYLNNYFLSGNVYYHRYLIDDNDYSYSLKLSDKFMLGKDKITIFNLETNKIEEYDLSDLKENELIVSFDFYSRESSLSNKCTFTYQNLTEVECKIIGYTIDNQEIIYINEQTLKTLYQTGIIDDGQYVKLDETVKCGNIYEKCLQNYKEENVEINAFLLGVTAILLLCSLIFLFFTMRSSLIYRVYEVGVYRAIGARKKDIYKIFTCEVCLFLLVSSVLGWLLSSLVLTKYSSSVYQSFVQYNLTTWITSFVIIVVTYLIIGLIPVSLLLALTPAQILSKYDI